MSLVNEPMKVCVNCGFMKEEVEGKKEDKKIRAPGKKTLSRLFSNSELRARLLHLEPHIYCTLIPGGSLTQYSCRIKLKAQFDTLLCIRIVKDENSNLPS